MHSNKKLMRKNVRNGLVKKPGCCLLVLPVMVFKLLINALAFGWFSNYKMFCQYMASSAQYSYQQLL
jgi:hypothetical protein